MGSPNIGHHAEDGALAFGQSGDVARQLTRIAGITMVGGLTAATLGLAQAL